MMKSNRDNFIFYLTQIVPVIVALVISIIIYRYWSDNNKACLALTWAAIIFLFLCFYNIIFKNKRNGMIIPILSGLSILLFANKFYSKDAYWYRSRFCYFNIKIRHIHSKFFHYDLWLCFWRWIYGYRRRIIFFKQNLRRCKHGQKI